MLFSSMLIIFSLIFVFTGCQKQETVQELPSNNYLPSQDSTYEDFGDPVDIEDSPESNRSSHELDIYRIHHYHII